MGIGAGMYMYDVVVKEFTFAAFISWWVLVILLFPAHGSRSSSTSFGGAFFELVTVETFSYRLRRWWCLFEWRRRLEGGAVTSRVLLTGYSRVVGVVEYVVRDQLWCVTRRRTVNGRTRTPLAARRPRPVVHTAQQQPAQQFTAVRHNITSSCRFACV